METVMPIVTEDYTLSDTRKYKTHVLPRLKEIFEWVRDGYTDYSIADSLGICHATLIEYKKTQTKLIETYIRARTSRNTLVMNAQFERAKGIKETIKKAFKVKEVLYTDGKRTSETEHIEYGDEFIYVPPDVNAADLYLRNNDPEYKGAKDVGSLTLIQHNYQLSDARAEIAKLLQEYKQLESIEAVDVQVIEDK